MKIEETCITSGRGERPKEKPKKFKNYLYGTFDESKFLSKLNSNKSIEKPTEKVQGMQRQHSAKIDDKYVKIFKELEHLNKKYSKQV